MTRKTIFCILLTAALTLSVTAQTTGKHARPNRPIIQTKFTADPAPMVWNDTVFLYVSHDEDDAPEGYGRFLMYDWQLYKSTDMVNWTDCGKVADLSIFPWGPQGNGAWAIQVVPRNGRFYLYAPLHMNGIGVAVGDSPYGPFRDALGHHFINNSMDDIDPTVWIDDDGQAYLYWGNPNLNLRFRAQGEASTVSWNWTTGISHAENLLFTPESASREARKWRAGLALFAIFSYLCSRKTRRKQSRHGTSLLQSRHPSGQLHLCVSQVGRELPNLRVCPSGQGFRHSLLYHLN